MKRRLAIALCLGAGATAAFVGAATVLAHDEADTVPPGAVVVENGPPAVDELHADLEGRSGVPAPVREERPPIPTFEPGTAKLVSPDSELGRRYNPDRDPNMRICQFPDGRIGMLHRRPLRGQNPYPNTPEDLRSRPC